jgi:RNA polymerase sigma-70 factor (ECF subfamily)
MSGPGRASRLLRRVRRRPIRNDFELVQALRSRDEDAFTTLVDRHYTSLLRVARMYVPSQAVAEEVVQETWIAVLRGIDGFQGRSSFKTWLFSILVNIAKTRGQREGRSLPFASVWDPASDAEGRSVDPDRFLPPDHPTGPNGWALGPTSWPAPEEDLLAGETRQVILDAVERLPPAQREVITLRDIEGWSSEDARNALGLSETNQRVLLHRARSKVRRALEAYFGAVEPTI